MAVAVPVAVRQQLPVVLVAVVGQIPEEKPLVILLQQFHRKEIQAVIQSLIQWVVVVVELAEVVHLQLAAIL